ncbi:MAG: SpoIID/LytB domain-containing protein [Lachnospiraceae bacterium]|nr:SpoIID/LytB domain-containing protein [Lachnospiraceae bacterium]
MKKETRILLKLILIIVCVCVLIFLIKKDTRVFRMEQPEGEGIEADDVEILMQAFAQKAACSAETGRQLEEWILQIQNAYVQSDTEFLLYEDYIGMITLLSDDKQFRMESKYKEGFYILKEDWYKTYDNLLALYGLQEIIEKSEIFLLTGNENLAGEKMDEGSLLSAEGEIYTYSSGKFKDCYFSKVRAYVSEDKLLTVREKEKGSVTMENVWVMEADEWKIQFFVHGFEIAYEWKEGEPKEDALRESISDITFSEGHLSKINVKSERVSGRLLRMGEEDLELQDKGTFAISDNCKVYQLYEELCETDLSDLRIGYDFADYVLDRGKICAVLIMRKENMESIRIAVMNSNFKSLYHDSLTLAADCEVELIYGPYEERERKVFNAGEKIEIDSESNYLDGDRVELVPAVKSGRIQVFSIDRNQGTPSYRGRMEIVKTGEGLVLINELLLEEYLYSVVPSEMPASYAPEALKAQAVCARTYAYRYLIHPGLPDLGAHVDDSVNYQVYNNIVENVNSTKAVKETTGILLYHGSEAVSTYYYSTSCGFGTDAGVWNESNKETMPYLSSVHIAENDNTGEGSEDEEEITPEQMSREEEFREYILNTHEEDYEKEEAWYRWQYDVSEMNVKEMAGRMSEDFSEVYDMYIAERREGGVAQKLILDTDAGIFETSGEYNIRYVLNNGGSVRKQDGTEAEIGKIIPSAYIIIDVVKDGGIVVGYTVFGGGYGHGVGMSQNGAKAMGNSQKSCEEILTFFYPECYMKKLY